MHPRLSQSLGGFVFLSHEVELSSLCLLSTLSRYLVVLSLGSTPSSALPAPHEAIRKITQPHTILLHCNNSLLLPQSSYVTSRYMMSRGFQNQFLQILQRWYRILIWNMEVEDTYLWAFAKTVQRNTLSCIFKCFFLCLFVFSGASWSKWSSKSQNGL